MVNFVSPVRTALVAALLPGLSSCGLFRAVVEAPASVARVVMPGAPGERLQPIASLHPRLLGLADSCVERARLAAATFATEIGTPEARIQGLKWRLGFSRAMLQAATGPVPLAGLLDTLVLVNAARLRLESGELEVAWGAPLRHLKLAAESMEALCWEVCSDYIGSAQISNLRAALAAWAQQNLDHRNTATDDFPNFRQLATAICSKDPTTGGGLLDFLTIDPLAGIEPVAREVMLTRQFTERMLFWAERMPALIDDQLALATLNAQTSPEVRTTLSAVDRASRATESIATTASLLTDDLSKERKAAIEQMTAALDAQRAALLRDLQQASAPVASMLVESRSTIESGRALATELTGTVQAVDAMLRRFDQDPSAPPPPATEPGRPFDIVEYGDAAARIGTAAVELRATIATLDAALPQIDTTVAATIARLDASLESALQKGLYVGLALLTAGAAVLLAVRVLGSRLTTRAGIHGSTSAATPGRSSESGGGTGLHPRPGLGGGREGTNS